MTVTITDRMAENGCDEALDLIELLDVIATWSITVGAQTVYKLPRDVEGALYDAVNNFEVSSYNQLARRSAAAFVRACAKYSA